MTAEPSDDDQQPKAPTVPKPDAPTDSPPDLGISVSDVAETEEAMG